MLKQYYNIKLMPVEAVPLGLKAVINGLYQVTIVPGDIPRQCPTHIAIFPSSHIQLRCYCTGNLVV